MTSQFWLSKSFALLAANCLCIVFNGEKAFEGGFGDFKIRVNETNKCVLGNKLVLGS